MLANHASKPEIQAPIESDIALRAMFDRHFSVELAFSPELLDEVLALRYQVYCRERAFENADCFPASREYDAYDTRSVHALVRHRASGECIAAVRLVLADEDDPAVPFPVEAHCGDALPGAGMAAIEKTPRRRVAEISRLAVSQEIRQRMARDGDGADGLDQYAQAYIVVGLFSAIVQLSAKLGISHWLAVMEPTCLRLLRRFGIRFCHVGGIVDYHGRRKPAVAKARTVVDGIKSARPDVWHLITASGSTVPDHAPSDNSRHIRPSAGARPATAGS